MEHEDLAEHSSCAVDNIIAAFAGPQQAQLRRCLRIALEQAQAQNDRATELKIVQTLRFLFPNHCKNILDRHLKFRILNFLLLHILDDLLFWVPQKNNYSEIPLSQHSTAQHEYGKLFLGRMLSQHELNMLYKISPRGLLIVSLQIPEETYANDGSLLQVPIYNWKILRGNCDIPEYMQNVKSMRFCGGGVFDHCFRDAEEGNLVTIDAMLHELEIVNNALQGGQNVYVHCWAGKERSVTFVISYLIVYRNFTLARAAAHVKRHRRLAKSFHDLKCQQKFFLAELFLQQIFARPNLADKLFESMPTLIANVKLLIAAFDLSKMASRQEMQESILRCVESLRQLITMVEQRGKLDELLTVLGNAQTTKLHAVLALAETSK